jgi:hypothetical protein
MYTVDKYALVGLTKASDTAAAEVAKSVSMQVASMGAKYTFI